MTVFKPSIGKNIIETLTMGMYDDPRFIFREYIQNSADQIDQARRAKLYKQQQSGEIKIVIEKDKKLIVFEDDATGIKAKEAQSLLGNVAQSTKDKYKDKGFRGIGRLGGLAYCNKLTFETSYTGEETKSIMVWDAKQLRKVIDNPKLKIEASALISAITDFSSTNEKSEAHYFKVIMEGVKSDELLDLIKVKEYLSMVAPVPLPKSFSFTKKIYERALKERVVLDEYSILLNDEILNKAYKDILYNKDGTEFDKIIDVDFFKSELTPKSLLYWGWYGISEKMQQIPMENNERFLRLRKANIQIGLKDQLNEFHKEHTGNSHFIGEVHALSSELIPNARRDFFIDSPTTTIFKQKLKDFFHTTLHKFFYDFAKKNSSLKILEEAEKPIQANNGRSPQEEIKATQRIEKAKKDLNQLYKKHEQTALGKVIKEKAPSHVTDGNQGSFQKSTALKANNSTSSKLSTNDNRLVSRIFTVIRQNLTQKAADDLISKIEKIL